MGEVPCDRKIVQNNAQHGLRIQSDRVKNKPNNTGKILDLFFSTLIPVLAISLIMLEYAFLISLFTTLKALLLTVVTAIIGFAIFTFVGHVIDIIGKLTLYKLFLKTIKQIPLLSKIANKIIVLANKYKK